MHRNELMPKKTYDWPGPGGNALIGKHKIKATLKYSLSPFLFRETKATWNIKYRQEHNAVVWNPVAPDIYS